MVAAMLLAATATFVLMVTVGDAPTYQRGEFSSYSRCVESAAGEIAGLGDNVRWDCVPVPGSDRD
jgi:hypothetical protein